jgi:hypothetical protein
MQRKMAAYTVAASLILTLGVTAAHTSAAHARPAHAARPADRVTACGVERWRVKVGLDFDARLVKQNVVVPTTIGHLRALKPPTALPRTNRCGVRAIEDRAPRVVRPWSGPATHLGLRDLRAGGRPLTRPGPQRSRGTRHLLGRRQRVRGRIQVGRRRGLQLQHGFRCSDPEKPPRRLRDFEEGAGLRGRALLEPSSLAVSPDGKQLYSAAFASDAVAVFERVTKP